MKKNNAFAALDSLFTCLLYEYEYNLLLSLRCRTYFVFLFIKVLKVQYCAKFALSLFLRIMSSVRLSNCFFIVLVVVNLFTF